MLAEEFSNPHNLMHLRPYLDTLPRGGSAAFAASLGISPVYLLQLAAGQGGRKPSPELCVQIERESGGAVTRRDLREDWKAIWPELERRSDDRTEIEADKPHADSGKKGGR